MAGGQRAGPRQVGRHIEGRMLDLSTHGGGKSRVSVYQLVNTPTQRY